MGRLWEEDTGSTTVESALGIGALLSVVLLVIGAFITVASYIGAVDAAGAAARSHALGLGYTSPRGEVTIHEQDGLVTATVRVPAPWGSLSATAITPAETYTGPGR